MSILDKCNHLNITLLVYVQLVINAGQAKPAPPVGPALGQAGLNIMRYTLHNLMPGAQTICPNLLTTD